MLDHRKGFVILILDCFLFACIYIVFLCMHVFITQCKIEDFRGKKQSQSV